MPNWVWNNIAVKKEDSKYLLNDKREVDFNVLCPMPEELSRTISGGTIDECVLYYIFKTSRTKKEFFERRQEERRLIGTWYIVENKLKPSMTKEQIEKSILERIGDNPRMFNDEMLDAEFPKHTPFEVGEWYYNIRKKYGASDWYEWSNRYWGCIWNASDSCVREHDGLICASFSTPWSAPEEFLYALSNVCPFYLEWEEEQGYHGEIYCDGNDFYDEPLDDFTWNEDTEEMEGEYVFDHRCSDVLNWKVA